MKPIFQSVDSATKNLYSRGYTRLLLGFFSALVSFSLLAAPHEARAQAQAANGVIEGTVTDASGAVIPNAKVKVVNLDTGLEREATTNEKGLYRAPLLPVGNYKITVTQAGFNTFVQSGITLSAGQAATVDVALKTGAVNSEVSIVADSPIADVSRVELGRTINENEVQNLPLPSRNPYNFGLLQPGVIRIYRSSRRSAATFR
jgi:hypothetical protein